MEGGGVVDVRDTWLSIPPTQQEAEEIPSDFWGTENVEDGIGKTLARITNTLKGEGEEGGVRGKDRDVNGKRCV